MHQFPQLFLVASLAWALLVQDSTDAAANPMPRDRHHHRILVKESSCILVEMCTTNPPGIDDETSWSCELSPQESSRTNYSPFADLDVDSNPEVAGIVKHATSGTTRLAFSEAVLSSRPGQEPTLHIPDTARVRVVPNSNDDSAMAKGGLAFSSRAGAATPNADEHPSNFGTLTALMVRVTDRHGVEPDYDSTVLHDNLFRGVSLGTQMEACSHDQLRVQPFVGTLPSGLEVTNGIVEMTADELDIVNDSSDVRPPLWKASTEELGDGYRQKADIILYCLPPGREWYARAYVGRGFSWYMNEACISAQAQMHEIGHNLGLGHSGLLAAENEERKEYGDTTGSMGSAASSGNDYMCYNPHKSWFLEWYQDQTLSIDPLDGTGTREILLNGISDYEANPDAVVSLRLVTPPSEENDYYVGYNRASGVHQDTKGDPDMVTVVYAAKGSAGQSYKVGSLVPGQSHEIQDFDGNGNTVTVRFFGILHGGDVTVQVIDGPTPPPPPPGECGKTVTVELKTDRYPGDTSWSIFETDGIGQFVDAEGGFEDEFTTYTKEVCLPKRGVDATYEFRISDQYSDGICCSQGWNKGSGFKIYDDDEGTVYADFIDVDYRFSTSSHFIGVPASPTESPTSYPTTSPTNHPTRAPTQHPTPSPTTSPTNQPTSHPTKSPTVSPTTSPTSIPTSIPTKSPTSSPTNTPTNTPTSVPTSTPTSVPTKSPTQSPTQSQVSPSQSPSQSQATFAPTMFPTVDVPDGCSDATKSEWTYRGKKNKDCHWVSKKPFDKRKKFCGKRANKDKQDKTKVYAYCGATCFVAGHPKACKQ